MKFPHWPSRPAVHRHRTVQLPRAPQRLENAPRRMARQHPLCRVAIQTAARVDLEEPPGHRTVSQAIPVRAVVPRPPTREAAKLPPMAGNRHNEKAPPAFVDVAFLNSRPWSNSRRIRVSAALNQRSRISMPIKRRLYWSMTTPLPGHSPTRRTRPSALPPQPPCATSTTARMYRVCVHQPDGHFPATLSAKVSSTLRLDDLTPTRRCARFRAR